MSFFSLPDMQFAANHTGLYLSTVKGKDKKWGHCLAAKVIIQFNIELVYSIWKPVIWKYNFSNSLNVQWSSCSRSSSRRCSVRKDVLRNLAKFTGKHLCQSLYFNKVTGLRQFSGTGEFGQISKNTFFTEHVWATASDHEM